MPGSGNAHPVWQELLNEIPESLHEIVKPAFIKFDANVQQQLEAKNTELKQFEPFKQFIDNQVDPAWLAEAADFTYNFQNDPKAVIENANKVWDLGYNLDGTTQQQQPGDNSNNQGLFDDEGNEMPQDITQHPQFAELMKTVNATQQQLQEFTQRQSEQDQTNEWNNYLVKMHEEHGEFNDDFVTSLVANGKPFPQALEDYQNLVAGIVGEGNHGDPNGENNSNNEQAGQGNNEAPVVMGSAGSNGSGLPEQPISFADMKSDDLEKLVEGMITAGNSDNNS